MKNLGFLSGVHHIPIIGLVSGGILFSVLIYSMRPHVAPSSHTMSRTVNITVQEATFRFAVATSSSPAAVLTYNFSARMDINYVYGSYRPSATKLFDVYFSFAGQRFLVVDESVPTALNRTLVIGPVSGNEMLGAAAVDEYLKAASMTTSTVVSSIEVELAVLGEVRYDDPALTVCSLVAKCPFSLPLWTIGVGLETTFYDVKSSLDMGWSSMKDIKTTVISKPTYSVRGRSKRVDDRIAEARARARVRAKREARWAAAPP